MAEENKTTRSVQADGGQAAQDPPRKRRRIKVDDREPVAVEITRDGGVRGAVGESGSLLQFDWFGIGKEVLGGVATAAAQTAAPPTATDPSSPNSYAVSPSGVGTQQLQGDPNAQGTPAEEEPMHKLALALGAATVAAVIAAVYGNYKLKRGTFSLCGYYMNALAAGAQLCMAYQYYNVYTKNHCEQMFGTGMPDTITVQGQRVATCPGMLPIAVCAVSGVYIACTTAPYLVPDEAWLEKMYSRAGLWTQGFASIAMSSSIGAGVYYTKGPTTLQMLALVPFFAGVLMLIGWFKGEDGMLQRLWKGTSEGLASAMQVTSDGASYVASAVAGVFYSETLPSPVVVLACGSEECLGSYRAEDVDGVIHFRQGTPEEKTKHYLEYVEGCWRLVERRKKQVTVLYQAKYGPRGEVPPEAGWASVEGEDPPPRVAVSELDRAENSSVFDAKKALEETGQKYDELLSMFGLSGSKKQKKKKQKDREVVFACSYVPRRSLVSAGLYGTAVGKDGSILGTCCQDESVSLKGAVRHTVDLGATPSEALAVDLHMLSGDCEAVYLTLRCHPNVTFADFGWASFSIQALGQAAVASQQDFITPNSNYQTVCLAVMFRRGKRWHAMEVLSPLGGSTDAEVSPGILEMHKGFMGVLSDPEAMKDRSVDLGELHDKMELQAAAEVLFHETYQRYFAAALEAYRAQGYEAAQANVLAQAAAIEGIKQDKVTRYNERYAERFAALSQEGVGPEEAHGRAQQEATEYAMMLEQAKADQVAKSIADKEARKRQKKQEEYDNSLAGTVGGWLGVGAEPAAEEEEGWLGWMWASDDPPKKKKRRDAVEA
mmetsp:Transcript_25399/g.65327  ORF Transcript_25399/g.65327 Transcript_25399/m.65327 type:complete len:829 (-) Transcript_25399:148-2634(-)